MSRSDDLERVYQELGVFARSSRELSVDLHPGLSLVEYTLLSFVAGRPGIRAADVAAAWGLDKSTVSRQLAALVEAGLLSRPEQRPGRRGRVLELTDDGDQALARAAQSVRTLMLQRLTDWDDGAVRDFARALERFNDIG